jgi:hypothetical protein
MVDMENVAPLLCDHGQEACQSSGLVIQNYGKVHSLSLTGKRLPDDPEEPGTFNIPPTYHEHNRTAGLHINGTIQ